MSCSGSRHFGRASRFSSRLLLGLVLTAAFGNAGAAIVQIHANNTSITIPASGATTPYPSDILISGITGNLITQVAVQLNGLSHTFPADLDVLLVGPGGERVMLLSDAGSSAAISDVNLLFSPTATASPPQASQLVTGTVLPANYANDANSSDFTDPFPNPAPDVLDREPADLTVFNGTNPNGTWSLYVSDDFQGADGGTIATGWTLFLTVPTIFTVTKTADTNDGVCDGDCSLREAISAASAATGNNDLIAFSGLFLTPQTIVLGGSALNIGESMTVQGPGADLLTISANHASSAFAVGGPGTVTLRGLAIRNGMTSGDGGGIYSEAAQLNLHNVAVAGNYASASGAGVFMFGGRNQFTSCIFNDNQSVESGSAILQYADVNAELKLVNTTISGNRSNSQAALWLFEAGDGTAALDILNSTIAHNSGTDGGGIAVTTLSNSNAQANVSLRNTILANNGARNIQTETQGGGPITINSLGFNLTNEDTGGHFDQATDLVGVDPRLGPLTNNGGQTESHALMGGSPALDAGVRTGYQRDQRGQLRAFDAPGVDTASGSDGSDIGALEMQAIVVAFSDDTSLRQAILDANAAAPAHSDILFNPDWFSSPRIINLESALPAIATSVNIVGPGSKFANVHRSGAGDYRIFEVMNADGREFSISGLTISNGSWPGTGGGIYSIPRTALTEVNVFNNYSTVSGGGDAELGRATIKDSTFALNSALGLGSALYVAGSGSTPGHVRVINSTFFGNVGGPAPGIALVSQFGQSNTLELINSTITSNSGSSDGGLRVHTAGSGSSTATAFVRNSIVAGNTFPNLNATSSGGGASVIDSRGYNLTNDASASYFDQATDKFNTNPLLGGLQDNGGPTTTVALLPNSPALDAGGRSGYLSDQRRLKRPVDQTLIINAADGNGSDIGAVEMVPELVFKNGFEQ